MHIFRDANGRQWSMVIDVNAAKRVRALCGIDLFNLLVFGTDGNLSGDLLERLSSDPILLVDTLYAICKPEADRAGISDEQFGSALIGDVIESASDALLDELVDFFPSSRRLALSKMLGAGRKLREARAKELEALLESGVLDRELEKVVMSEPVVTGEGTGESLGNVTAERAWLE